MILVRLSFRNELTPVPSCGSVFIYMTPVQNLILERVKLVQIHPGYCSNVRFLFITDLDIEDTNDDNTMTLNKDSDINIDI